MTETSVPARIVDVAALAGVSPGTASKALNGTGQLRPETRERVRRAAEQLGFTPDSLGRALSSGRSYTVGLITTDSFGRFSIPVMLGAENTLGAGEMVVLLCDSRDDPLREQHYLRTLLARRVDGIIITGRRTEPRPPVAAAGRVPVVYAFTPSQDRADTSLVVDQAGGAAAAVRHVLDLGRRRVAHVTGPADHHAAVVRRDAAAAEAGAHLVDEPLHGDWSERWGRLAADLLLRRHPDVDAITCGSDQIARGVCDGLRDAGRRVPQDVAVVGFDDWDVIALASRPPLTTVALGLEAMGRRAGELLLEAVAGRRAPGTTVMPTRLVVRESTVGA
ncbi:LacI family DNA-binding transcriptional regulator [Kineococcus indalonis]|uniref:LacI family DNA-binding transcriptional regulator n=1 Tax=Kineococcus indalonis TaxID=2696566 RepID=UPI001412578C|nr:LacI family DNA-binding transcriptional regulator [Kineococcus indalonis]NAZ84817.1 substrate-binding domain-containing protein [Kineococcus indalonis]